MATELTVCVSEPGFSLATWHNVFICVSDRATMKRLADIRRFEARLVAASPKGIGVASVVVEPGALWGTMTSEERAEAADLARTFAPHMLGLAHIVLGGGFFAATVRAVISGVQLVSRTKAPSSVFRAIPPGAEWLAERCGKVDATASDARALAAAIESVTTPLAGVATAVRD